MGLLHHAAEVAQRLNFEIYRGSEVGREYRQVGLSPGVQGSVLFATFITAFAAGRSGFAILLASAAKLAAN